MSIDNQPDGIIAPFVTHDHVIRLLSDLANERGARTIMTRQRPDGGWRIGFRLSIPRLPDAADRLIPGSLRGLVSDDLLWKRVAFVIEGKPGTPLPAKGPTSVEDAVAFIDSLDLSEGGEQPARLTDVADAPGTEVASGSEDEAPELAHAAVPSTYRFLNGDWEMSSLEMKQARPFSDPLLALEPEIYTTPDFEHIARIARSEVTGEPAWPEFSAEQSSLDYVRAGAAAAGLLAVGVLTAAVLLTRRR